MTLFKHSIGSCFSSAAIPSIHLNRQHGSQLNIPPNTFIFPRPVYWISVPSQSFFLSSHPSLWFFLSFPLFSSLFLHRLGIKSPLKSIPCAKSACASFPGLPRESGYGERNLYQGTPNSLTLPVYWLEYIEGCGEINPPHTHLMCPTCLYFLCFRCPCVMHVCCCVQQHQTTHVHTFSLMFWV